MTRTLLKLNPDRDALFLDIDGTLLDIAQTPNGVIVPNELKSSLKELYEKLNGALAIISGRTIEDIDNLFKPLKLPVAGVHGAEWRIGSKAKKEQACFSLPENMHQTICNIFKEYNLIKIEDKAYTIAVHYRQAPHLEKMIGEILRSLIVRTGENIELLQGKMVFEIMRPEFNKAFALEQFMKRAPFAGRKAIYLGDDKTDIPAINKCQEHQGIGMLVAKGNYFSSPTDVRKWLKEQAWNKLAS